MQGLKYLTIITKREFSENYLDFFRKHNVNAVLSSLCNGTTSESALSLMGLEKTEKVILHALVREEIIGSITKGLIVEMDILSAGNGIAAFIPIDSIGGKYSLNYFAGDEPLIKKENDIMNVNETKNVLIITIVDKGNTDLVMDAARTAGAGGGTVVRAKGTGAHIAKFFGVSISEEKELVYIIAKRESRDAIMKSIMDNAGNNTDAHGIIFSLPVDSVVGLKCFDEA